MGARITVIKSVLHGTWVAPADGEADDSFFVWAERGATPPRTPRQPQRVLRHPFAATTIEISDLLATYVPGDEWRSAERLTRVALLPSSQYTPLVPRWLLDGESDTDEAPPELVPWRIEGIGIPILRMLDVLAVLPLANHALGATHRVGDDLRYWGVVAKYALELLARQRFVPGLRTYDGTIRAVWLPFVDDPHDRQRLEALAHGMPPVCRAVFRDRRDIQPSDAPRADVLVQSFLERLIDQAVRDWVSLEQGLTGESASAASFMRPATQVGTAWWRGLSAQGGEIPLNPSHQRDLSRFYQAWQSWTYRDQPTTEGSFRLCLRLEPPEFESVSARVVSPHWTLRYFMQAHDDPSLLVPASEVWRERGNVLSYLSHRFDQPQEKLLAGLGMAARLSPPIQRSLKSERPEATLLSAQEAYIFLRETARLLEGMGFGVLVPPWWSKPDARLRVRAKLRASSEISSSGILNMDSLVQYDWELAIGDEPLTREEFERLAALKTPLVQVRGRWVLLQPDQVEAAIAFWERQQSRGEMALHDALGLALGAQTQMDGLSVSEVELDDWLTNLLSVLDRGDQLENLDPPDGFVGQLRPYQVRGFSWLVFLRRWGLGACLADDMGLGKTIQAIALLLHALHTDRQASPSLLICPTSLVGNWQREVARFAPEVRVMVHHGSGRAEGRDFLRQVHDADLVISTYGLARRDVDDLTGVQWSNVILDEAQNIKNPVTKQARAIRKLRGDYRLVLTGTPIENRLSELWSIMSFLNPGYLGSLERFRRNYALPIERYQDSEASEQLRKLVRPFILRRLKTDPHVIQDLPDKFEYRVFCNLTREQATLYEAVVRDAMKELDAYEPKTQDVRRRGLVLAMLTRLKQVCNHPTLFLGDGSDTVGRSGKLNRLTEMLEEVLAVGDRALVFTQFAQMGMLLQKHLQSTFQQEVLFLHGGTPQKQRDRMLLRFQEDSSAPAIFVLSLKAGGTGLNLMRANHVFHFDRWWNPAVENQATDRAYRIGQTRDVQVHKYICLGTLEERIDMLIESKRALAESVVGAGESWLTDLGTEELREIIALRTEAVEAD
ncbi:MAG: DEAD/DEAH box helicase [Anaerolineae bacterium]